MDDTGDQQGGAARPAMKIDVLGVQAFVAVAEHGSFRKAAQTLHITQTAVTQRLRNLETFLGVTLIERTTRSVGLTRLGREFLPQARRLLAELSAALTEIRETGAAQRGDVTIACVPTAGVQFLPGVLEEYAARYPENRVKVLDHASSGVADAVLLREAEFGINVAGSHPPELQSRPLLEDEFVLICREDHLLAKKRRVSWRALEPYPLIFAGQVSGNRALLEAALDADLALRFNYEVQRSSTAVGMVAAGVAAAVVPRLALQKGAYPAIRVLALTDPAISRKLVLIARKGARLSPAAQALFDMIAQRAR